MHPCHGRISVSALFVVMCVASSACAQDETGTGNHPADRLQQLEQELAQLRSELIGDEGGGREASGIEQAGWVSFPDPELTNWRAGAPGTATPPRYPTFHWSGFLQLDSGWIQQDDLNVATVGDVEALVGLRRVRLRAFGDVRDNAHYVVDLDFAASGHPSFRDVYLGFRDVPVLQNGTLGYFKTPFSMDAETSGQELLLLERQPPFAFTPFRQTGIGINGSAWEETVTWSAATYSFPTDSFGVGLGDGFAASGRLTALPFLNEQAGRFVHVGIGYGIGAPADDTVRYSIEPGFFVTDPDDMGGGAVPVFVDTGNIPANLFQLFNLEFAGAFGPFRWQAETRFSMVDQIGGPQLTFSGSYVQIGLILTGERPQYDRRRAIFNRVVPDDEFAFRALRGALELAGGWSVIDLNDKNITGGKMYTTTFGINWYMTEYTRFMLNVDPVVLQDPALGRSEALVVGTRFQVSF